jgi:Tol biopolymer transport system component
VTYAALSPDASAVAFTAYSPNASLEVLDLSTGTRQTLAQADDTLGDPVWSPDGSAIAFWRIDDGHPHIYVVQADGDQWGQPRQITKGDTVDVSPAWSPDGAELAFDRHGQVWTVGVRSGTAHELSGAAAGLQQPFWGSDPDDLYALAPSDDLPSSRFRVVKLNSSTGAQVGTSQEFDGTASEAQADPAGIQVVALVRPSVTTALMSFNRNLVQVSRVSIPDVLITNLRPKDTA